MIWHYRCPDCRRELQADWADAQHEHVCPGCRSHHYPPMPSEDHAAYVGGDRWPKEMEETVIKLRGTVCSVRGCYHEYKTLVRRRPLLKGGRLSVENLLQMCPQHAREMGTQDYDEWVATLPATAAKPEAPTIEITITADSHAEESKSKAQPRSTPDWVETARPIAGRAAVPGPFPEKVRLVGAAPFLPGSGQRLLLLYDWSLEANDSCLVVFAAWPNNQAPDFSKGVENLKLSTFNMHRSAEGQQGSAVLQLDLPGPSAGLWTAAVILRYERERPVITNYLIAVAPA